MTGRALALFIQINKRLVNLDDLDYHDRAIVRKLQQENSVIIDKLGYIRPTGKFVQPLEEK